MAKEFRPYYVLTGGVDGSLDSELVAGLEDFDASFVQTDGIFYSYHFDASATDAESSPMYIRPDDYSSAGVHVLQSIGCNNLVLQGGLTLGATGWVNATHVHLAANSGGQITEASISDLQAYIIDITGSPLSELSDTTITGIASGELLKWNGAAWINNTLVEAGVSATGHSHTESDISDLGTLTAMVADNLSVFAATTSAQLAGIISDETGTGAAVFGTSPTIITPTIASLANAQHDHLDAVGGGQITEAAISDLQSYYVPGGTDVAVTDGGTGRSTSTTAYGVICAGTTATGAHQTIAGIGTSGQVLTSNGAGALPTFQAAGGGGLGSNLSSTTNDILSDTGTIVLGGTGNTNNENLTFDFETTANEVAIGSGTGVTNFNFTGTIELEPTTSSTTGVIYKGANRFIHNFQHPTGDTAVPDGNNLFIGINAGNFTMGSTATQTYHGSYNIAEGANALQANTTGYSNVAQGDYTLYANTTGYQDIAQGANALRFNTTGYRNVAQGANALRFNTTGYRNVAQGYNAGRYYNGTTGDNTTSDDCTIIGASASVSADGVQRETVIGNNAIGKGTDTAIIGEEGVNDYVYLSGGMIVNEGGGDLDSRIEGSTETNLFYVDAGNDRVGIGTAAPSTVFHVDSNAVDTTAIITIENTGGNFQVFRDDASPETVISGSIGDLCVDTTGGGIYIKKTGAASTAGWMLVNPPTFKSYTIADPGTAGTYYLAGYYEAPAADSTLTIGGTVTQTLGAANVPYAAHAFCVASGAGGTDLVLTVSGTSITDGGTRTPADSEVIVADTDAASTDEYFETTKKWLGQVTYTLTGAAGAFTFNYGFAKYEDFGNRDFSVTDIENVGVAGANSTANIELLHHSPTGWTYSAAAFSPGGTVIIDMNTVHNTEIDIDNDIPFAFKHTGLSTSVSGSGMEGVILKITTGSNNAISYMDAHIGVMLK